MLNNVNVSREEVNKYGIKLALLLVILKGICNYDGWTRVSYEMLKEWGFTCRVQQPLLEKAVELNLIESKFDRGQAKGRYIKLKKEKNNE